MVTCVTPRAFADCFPETPTHTLTGVSIPVNVATGDLFGDGRPALLVASWVRVPGPKEQYDPGASRVLIFRQRQGEYRLPADREIAVKAPFGMEVGEFDGDDVPDLALSPFGVFELRLGKERLETPHFCPTPNGGAGQLKAARLNSAGTSDFVSGPVWRKWYGNDRWEQGYFCGPKINDNKLSLVADFDDDGERDLLFLPVGGTELRLYYGPFLNMMVAAEELSKFAVVAAPHTLAYLSVGDLNGDSRPDLVASTSPGPAAQRKTFVWHQNSPTGFTDNARPNDTIDGVCGPLAVADFNQDGLDDLLVASAQDSQLRVFLQKAGGSFATRAQDADQSLVVRNTRAVHIADLNGDRYPDVIHADDSTIQIFQNLGDRKPR